MSVNYRWVQWNRHSCVYDATAVGAIALFIGVRDRWFCRSPGERALSGPILLLRAFGVTALLLLHIVLAIGPPRGWTGGSCRCCTTVATSA